jgi:hypothetical protein
MSSSVSTAFRRALSGGALAVVLMLLATTSASAAGPAVQVGQPFTNDPPSIAVDATGTALIAWDDSKDLAGANDFVQYCVIPVGATGCAHSGKLIPAGGAQAIDGVQAVVDGSTYVILADVFGATTGHFEPEQEWQSTDGGATFNIVAGGKSVSSANLNADTGPLNAVIVPGTGVLGYGWETAAGPPTFNAFPLAAPPECSKATPCSFATLEPNSNPDVLGNGGGAVAAEAGASPGVLGVYSTLFNDGGPFSCPSSTPDGMAFAYGAGNQSATNSYHITPGSLHSAWRPATQGECGVQRFTVGGGPSGFGILGDDEATGTTFYQRFDQTNVTFADTPKITVSQQGELHPSLSQDGAGGLYATYENGGSGGPIALSYSGDGGKTWIGPNVLHAYDGLDHPISAVNGAGQGWVTWTNGGSVFAESFIAADATPPPAPTTLTTSQSSGTETGSSITIQAGTVGETDRATVLGANAASATGTVSYALYSTASCAAPSKVFSSTTAVSGGKAAASAPLTSALAVGKYYWVASYGGNSTNAPSTSGCGAEVLTVSTEAAEVKLGSGGSSDGTTITITVTCSSPPCTFTITITDPPAQQASVARKKRRAKPAALASGKVTVRKRGAQKVKLRLSTAGKKYMRSHHGTVKLSAAVTQTIAGHKKHLNKTIKVKISKRKHKKT